MTIYSTGLWHNGSKHVIIDDNPIKPDAEDVMRHFLALSENELMNQLSNEVNAGTLTSGMAENIIVGYLKRKTYNAYRR
jgi:hypothetical protein